MSGRTRPEPGEVVGIGYGTQVAGHDGQEAFWYHVRPDVRGFRLFHPGVEPTVLELVADPEGQYACWLEAGKDGFSMVQRALLFDMQFVYGSQAEEERGKGLRVTVSIRPAGVP